MKENFGDKINTGGFDKNPRNINRTGANRKSFATINEALKKKGIKPLSKSELIESYTLIFNATEEELQKIVQDKKTPFAFKLILTELKSSKTRGKALEDLRNYMFGQAAQEIKHEVKARVLSPTELKQYLEDLEKEY